MSADGLSQRDKRVLDAVGQDDVRVEGTDDPDELREIIDDLADELAETTKDFKEFKQMTQQRLHVIEQPVEGGGMSPRPGRPR